MRAPFVSDPDFTACECGCGEPAPIATYSHAARGWVKGQPKRFVSGHNSRARWAGRTLYAEDANGCWIWQGYVDRNGYGRLNVSDVPQLAHRVLYERATGKSPEALHHLCAVRNCVNPAHLQATTHAEHTRIEQAARTHCRRGHAYTEHGRFHTGKTARYCGACERENERRRSAAVR